MAWKEFRVLGLKLRLRLRNCGRLSVRECRDFARDLYQVVILPNGNNTLVNGRDHNQCNKGFVLCMHTPTSSSGMSHTR